MIIEELRDSKKSRYIILEEFTFFNEKTGKKFTCPKGFVTDYASTKIFKFDELGQPAALVHDVGYWFQKKTRAEEDTDFKNNLMFLGVNKIKVYVCWGLLRTFGWIAWNKNKNQRALFLDKNKILNEEELNKIIKSKGD